MTATPTPEPALELLVLASPALPVIHLGQPGPAVARLRGTYRDVTRLCTPGLRIPYVAEAVRPASTERIQGALEDARMCRACAQAHARLTRTALVPDGQGTDSLLALLDQEDPS
ncbi:hypothetical protein CWT12_06580 [Actinomyces sp. 432]|uniref:hypothetical protein n=1 Tax=Actinomyces sp. 432 TaxID=2057798 RepID=UPI001373EDCD|nr:hypothetical protein [Actinomyces sp. 432]QHO91054.1 hypothetical protein CWT12_06580 [Actinomyces sp. 432]